MTYRTDREKICLMWRWAMMFVVVAVLMLLFQVSSFAHGGEDHGEEKAPAIAAGAGMLARTTRAGDWEIVIKHPTLEPDKELAARVFVTRFDTNEPIASAQVKIIVASEAAPIEITANANATAGMYEAKLPPLPQNQYRLAVQVNANGSTQTAQFGTIQVAPAPIPIAESISGWARTALIALALLVALALAGVVTLRVMQNARRSTHKGETAAA